MSIIYFKMMTYFQILTSKLKNQNNQVKRNQEIKLTLKAKIGYVGQKHLIQKINLLNFNEIRRRKMLKCKLKECLMIQDQKLLVI